MAKPKHYIPKEVIVYVCDFANGEPVLAVAKSVEELDGNGEAHEVVGVFTLNRTWRYTVRRELK